MFVVLGIVFYRTRTHLVISDPSIYIGLARQLVYSETGLLDALRATSFVAPGYPVILAVAIFFCGDFAPFYVNLLFCLFIIWALGRLVFTVSGCRELALLTMACFLFFAVFGLPENPHFMLYPFRGPAMWACVLGGMLCYENALVKKRQGCWFLLGSIVFGMAVIIRETAVFAVLGAIVAVLLGFRAHGKCTVRNVFYVIGPYLAAVIPVLVVAWSSGKLMHYQANAFIKLILREFSSIEALQTHFLPNLLSMLGCIPVQSGNVGLVLLIVGILGGYKHPRLWGYFLIPLVLNILFYSTYRVHARYFLDAWFFAPVFIAIGGVVVATLVGKWIPRIQSYGFHFCILTVLGLLVASGIEAHQTASWGRYYQRGELTRFQAAVNEYEPERRWFSETTVSLFNAAMVSYSRLVRGDMQDLEKSRAPDESVGVYFRPINDACYNVRTTAPTMSVEKIIRYRHDLLPVSGDAQGEIALEEGRYMPFRIQAWGQTNTVQEIKMPQDAQGIYWINLQSVSAEAPVRISFRDSEGRQLETYRLDKKRGWQALFLNFPDHARPPYSMEVTSSSLLPGHFEGGFYEGDRSAIFDFEYTRGPAMAAWAGRNLPFRSQGRYGLSVPRNGELLLPTFHGERLVESVAVRVSVSALRTPPDGATLGVQARIADSSLQAEVDGLVRGRRQQLDLLVPLDEDGAPLPIKLLRTGDMSTDNVVLINEVAIQAFPRVP